MFYDIYSIPRNSLSRRNLKWKMRYELSTSSRSRQKALNSLFITHNELDAMLFSTLLIAPSVDELQRTKIHKIFILKSLSCYQTQSLPLNAVVYFSNQSEARFFLRIFFISLQLFRIEWEEHFFFVFFSAYSAALFRWCQRKTR